MHHRHTQEENTVSWWEEISATMLEQVTHRQSSSTSQARHRQGSPTSQRFRLRRPGKGPVHVHFWRPHLSGDGLHRRGHRPSNSNLLRVDRGDDLSSLRLHSLAPQGHGGGGLGGGGVAHRLVGVSALLGPPEVVLHGEAGGGQGLVGHGGERGTRRQDRVVFSFGGLVYLHWQRGGYLVTINMLRSAW